MPQLTVTESGQPPPQPDTYTPATMFGEKFIEGLGPWVTLHLAWYLDALGAMFSEVTTLAYDQGVDGQPGYVPGYGTLFNAATCPVADLPYLGQYVGVSIPAGSSATAARSLVMQEAGQSRGTIGAMTAAVLRHLTGTQYRFIRERQRLDGTPNAYQMVIGVLSGEVDNAAQMQADVTAVKPGGVLVNWIITPGYTWATSLHTWSADAFSWQSALTTQP